MINENFKRRIVTVKELQSEGISIAKLKENRDFGDNNISSKKKSLEKTGHLLPAMMIDAKIAAQQGITIVDFETDKEINENDLTKYVVLPDGNHRYKAYLELMKEDNDFDKDFYLVYTLNEELAIRELMMEINTETNKWVGKDWVKGAALTEAGKNIPLIKAINELTSKGYSAPAAGKWLTGLDGCANSSLMQCITKNTLSNKQELKLKIPEEHINRGKRLIQAAESKFKTLHKKRTLPDWVFDGVYNKVADSDKENTIYSIINFFNEISLEDAEKIENVKGKRGVTSKEQLQFDILNELWEKMN